ncbi:MAG TPA: HEAT repeat domain-containing protein [Ktedonobacteraceae bacterium]
MEHNDNERRLTTHTQQQAIPAWRMDGIDNSGLASPVSPALELVGLGRAASYLETHPEYLTAALTYSDWAMRTAAVQALGKQGQHTPLQPLLNALQDEHVAVRAMAARALGMQGERMPVEPLIVALHDPAWRVRTAAVLALGRLTNKTPVQALVPMMNDEHAPVRAAVVWAFGRLGEQAPIEQLVMALHDTAWSVREAAVMALKEQGERAPIGPLLAARWDEDSSVRQAAEAALDHRFEEQPGQKLVPENMGRFPSSWLRLVAAAISVVVLIPLTGGLFSGDWYVSRSDTVSKLIALSVVCLAISIINIIYQRKRLSTWSGQQGAQPGSGESTTSWHGVVLLAISVISLVVMTGMLLGSVTAGGAGITADIVYFILVSRLIALGCVSFTVVVVNKVFHVKR